MMRAFKIRSVASNEFSTSGASQGRVQTRCDIGKRPNPLTIYYDRRAIDALKGNLKFKAMMKVSPLP